MSAWNYLAAALMLCSLIFPVSSQELVALTVYVHDGGLDGALLSGVEITGNDADGNEFAAVTDSSGSAVVQGVPGTWEFAFQKDGYDTLYLTYDATQTEETAAYMEKSEALDLITLTVHVHDGDLSGDLLPKVQIKGQDGNGNEFSEITDSDGMAAVQGEPGTWEFAFQKDGYEVLLLKYNATQSEEAAAYLEKAD